MDGNEMFHSNMQSFQSAGWKVAKDNSVHSEDHYEGVTNISVTLETALLLSIAILGAIMLLAINLVGPVFCKKCFRRRPEDMERGDIFHLSPMHETEEDPDGSTGRECDSEENPPLIMENKHANFETVTYMQDADDEAQEVT